MSTMSHGIVPARAVILLIAALTVTMLSAGLAVAADGPRAQIDSESLVFSNSMTHPYLSDPLFRDAAGKLHVGVYRLGPHDGYYLSSTDDGATWGNVQNITRESTASKGGTVYINTSTGKGLYLGFFNVSGYNQNYTTNYGATWTTGAYRFIPGSWNGLTGYLYPLGSVYDGANTVYAMTWGSFYHGGNGKIGVSKTTNLGTTWTSLGGVLNTNTLTLDSVDRYAIDSAAMVLDANGKLYVLYLALDTAGKWNVKAYLHNGAVGSREVVHENLGYTRFGRTAVTGWLDPDGETIHAAYVVQTDSSEHSTIYHTSRNASGTWSAPEAIGSDGISRRQESATSTVDADGNVYLLWSNYDGVKYRMFSSARPAAAGWGPVTELSSDQPNVGAWLPWLRSLAPGMSDRAKVELVWTRWDGSARSVRYGKLSLVGVAPVDTTPPVVTPAVVGTIGANGWYRSDVNVSWVVSDPESEVTSTAGCEPSVVTQDTPGHILTCQATSAGGTTSQSVTVKRDATPPTIVGLPGSGCTLWPPNHRLVNVGTVAASDGLSGLAAAVSVTGISNEPANGLGDGDTAPDIVISGGSVQLRAERAGKGTGRTYSLSATATDVAGNTAAAAASCLVPQAQRK